MCVFGRRDGPFSLPRTGHRALCDGAWSAADETTSVVRRECRRTTGLDLREDRWQCRAALSALASSSRPEPVWHCQIFSCELGESEVPSVARARDGGFHLDCIVEPLADILDGSAAVLEHHRSLLGMWALTLPGEYRGAATASGRVPDYTGARVKDGSRPNKGCKAFRSYVRTHFGGDKAAALAAVAARDVVALAAAPEPWFVPSPRRRPPRALVGATRCWSALTGVCAGVS